MKKLLQILLFIPLIIRAQETYEITYTSFDDNPKEYKIYYQNDVLYSSKPDDKIQYFTDFKNKRNVSILKYNDSLYSYIIPFSDLPKPIEVKDNTNEKIAGYKCKYVKYNYFSNSVEIWYTEKAKAKGSLYSRFTPTENALVLKIRYNGNDNVQVKSIKKAKPEFDLIYNIDKAKQVNQARFEELKINSRYKIIPVFSSDTVNFDPNIKTISREQIQNNVTYHFSNGNILLKKIKLTQELKEDNYIFVKFTEQSNGDAYDRSGSIFLIPGSQKLSIVDACIDSLGVLPVYKANDEQEYQGIITAGKYKPPIELMRFFTPFGVGNFNEKRPINNYNWEKQVVYKQEITDLIPKQEDEVWIGVFIGNYDKGGHIVSLELDVYPGENKTDSTKINYIQPLFSTVNVMEAEGQNYGKLFRTDTLKMEFEIPENTSDLKLLYTSTGHGGWETGDEFIPKLNQIFIDDKEIFKIIPWRTDCATYRLYNPASGNFSNGISSSDLSRSNWCPGMLTPQEIVYLQNIKSGKHTLKVIIDQGENQGNAFSHWQVSGVLVGDFLK